MSPRRSRSRTGRDRVIKSDFYWIAYGCKCLYCSMATSSYILLVFDKYTMIHEGPILQSGAVLHSNAYDVITVEAAY